ncbi:his operon leader peptide [Escherichia coli]|nr:his operon leader peptide [Escherichia coli]EFL4491356.1 his operon leader peptide [Escherichia coli]
MTRVQFKHHHHHHLD